MLNINRISISNCSICLRLSTAVLHAGHPETRRPLVGKDTLETRSQYMRQIISVSSPSKWEIQSLLQKKSTRKLLDS